MAAVTSYPRSKFRDLRNAWLRRNWVFVAGAAIVTLCLGALVTLMVVQIAEVSPFTWYVLGLVHAAVIATLVFVLTHAFLVHDRDAINQLRGAWGEDNTTAELKKAQRRKLVWGWVDSVGLERGDLDHFVVTRDGGLVVLDSKFRTDISVNVPRLAGHAARVRTRAEGVARTVLGSKINSRHRERVNPIAVRPAVVVWGALQHEIPSVTSPDGVDVIAGRKLCAWLASLHGNQISEDAAHEILVGLREFQRRSATSNRA